MSTPIFHLEPTLGAGPAWAPSSSLRPIRTSRGIGHRTVGLEDPRRLALVEEQAMTRSFKLPHRDLDSMKTLLVSVLLLFPLVALADDACDRAVSDPEINECVARDFERADKALNAAYRKTLSELQAQGKDQPEALEARATLIKAQRLWVEFRENDCDALFTLNQSGTIRTAMYYGCMTSHAQQRTKELEDFGDQAL